MRKSVWMAQLERALSREGMTGTEKRTVMNFYEEMYQDKRDDGMEEEDIIKEFGFPEDVAQNVRDSEEYRNDSVRKSRATFENEDYEAQGYDIHPAKLYHPEPSPNYQPTPPAHPTPPAPVNSTNGGGILTTLIVILLDIVLFSLGLGLSIAGIAVIVASFLVISFNLGAWLIAFGIGLVLFACGCLIFASAIKLTKSATSKGGAK